MKKYTLALALAGLMVMGTASTANACEGGKCKMEQSDKKGKSKKGKKADAKAESCHAPTEKKEITAAEKACCAKKDAAKPAEAKAN